jgi:hypothetical protein
MRGASKQMHIQKCKTTISPEKSTVDEWLITKIIIPQVSKSRIRKETTFGLEAQVEGLNVASRRSKSPRSHGLHDD